VYHNRPQSLSAGTGTQHQHTKHVIVVIGRATEFVTNITVQLLFRKKKWRVCTFASPESLFHAQSPSYMF